MAIRDQAILNAFCVDLEEWFHVCGVATPYEDPSTWDAAPACVEQDTNVLLDLLAEAGCSGTFLSVGWVARKYPWMIRKISDAGHEIGCHGYYHRLVFEQTPKEFRREISDARKILQDVSGQEVTAFRAPGFSITPECFWAYPILIEEGFRLDVSVVPATRDHGGVAELTLHPFTLRTDVGDIRVFPVSVMRLMGRSIPFSGGGYLRLFPMSLVRYGFRQVHQQELPVMTYVHPREINPDQPRLRLPWAKHFKYYVGLRKCRDKLRTLLREYAFGTVSDVASLVDFESSSQVLSADESRLTSVMPLGERWERDAAPKPSPVEEVTEPQRR